MIFTPALDGPASVGSFYELVDSLTQDLFRQGSLVDRVAKHNGLEHYQVRNAILVNNCRQLLADCFGLQGLVRAVLDL